MGDLFQSPQPGGVTEDLPAQRRPIERPVASQDAGTELGHHLRQPWRPRRENFPGNRVGVHDHRPVRGEQPGDRALARPDTPGQADVQHVASLANRS